MHRALIEPKALATLMEQKSKIVLIDTREPPDYARGHIPNAINVPDVTLYFLHESSPEHLEKLQKDFALIFGQAGLTGSEDIVVYDESTFMGIGSASRGCFLLKYLGVQNVSVLHGGYRAWVNEGLPVTTDLPKVEKKEFLVRVNADILVTKEQMLEAAKGNSDAIILDVRSIEEWEGQLATAPGYWTDCPRCGRIPGAVWIDWDKFIEKEKDIPLYYPPEKIREICEKVGIKVNSKVYIYCYMGLRSSSSFSALEHAGIKDVRNYLASWNEWGRDMNAPIEN